LAVGYPLRVSFASVPEYDPYWFDIARMLADEGDLLIWTSGQSLLDRLQPLPTIVLGRRHRASQDHRFIPVGTLASIIPGGWSGVTASFHFPTGCALLASAHAGCCRRLRRL
jgi:hypothetical protein